MLVVASQPICIAIITILPKYSWAFTVWFEMKVYDVQASPYSGSAKKWLWALLPD